MIGSVFFENLWNFIVDHSKEFVSTIIVLLICLIAIVVGYFIEKKYSSKKGKKKYVIELAKNIFSFYRGFIIFVGILLICSTWGVKLTSVLIGLAIFFATIALGSRKIIADIIRGLEINFSNLYDLDDIVEINGFTGYVKDITLKTTKLLNINNEVRIIANSEIREITNYSKYPHVSSFEISLSNKENVKMIIGLLEDNFSKNDDKFEKIIEGPNVIGISEMTNDRIIIKIQYKDKYDLSNTLLTDIKVFVKEILDLNNINFEFFKRD